MLYFCTIIICFKTVFNKELTAYTLLPSMETGVHSHCVAVLNNFLYVVGGQNHFEERGKTSVATVTRFDVLIYLFKN